MRRLVIAAFVLGILSLTRPAAAAPGGEKNGQAKASEAKQATAEKGAKPSVLDRALSFVSSTMKGFSAAAARQMVLRPEGGTPCNPPPVCAGEYALWIPDPNNLDPGSGGDPCIGPQYQMP
jgi:hypothetical protein